MNRTFFILLCLLVASTAGCMDKVKEGFHISGKLQNVKPGAKVYLDELSLSAVTTIDTATFGKDGSFDIHGFLKEESLLRLRIDSNKVILLVMDQKPTEMYIEAYAANSFIKPSIIKGSPKTSTLYNLFQYVTDKGQEIQNLSNRIQTQTNLSDSAKQALFTEIKDKKQFAHDYIITFCDTVQSPVLGIFASSSFLQGEMTAMNLISEKLSKKFPQSTIVKEFATKLKTNTDDPYAPKQKYQNGQVLPDIVSQGVDGSEKKLSSLRGQYVLVDFWASWCRPCRGENPNVVAMYNKYKNKGFNVFSVSLDNDKDRWQSAIQQDKLTWPNHVSELKGWQSSFCGNFGITSIPTNYLIDKEGKVMGFGLRGEELEKKLAEIFK